ncbi:MAG: DUF2461 domain-containing protein [Acidobacteriia bacterium]|nr:DUF2461 domain-containing protein [Terriglobia bacterium]
MAQSAFPGFPQEGITFFRGLARHNNREWFLPRKAVFEEQVKAPMRALVTAVNRALARFAPAHVAEPEKAIYRFYRDTRFSPDKTPYKDHIAATFARRGLGRHDGAGYYCAVSHKEVAIAGGVYMPTPETLAAMRRHIAARHRDFRRILAARPLRNLFGEIQGEQLARVPKGYCSSDPAADLLRFKQLYFYAQLPPEIAVTPALLDEILKRFRAVTPFVDFLNEPLIAQRKKAAEREMYF